MTDKYRVAKHGNDPMIYRIEHRSGFKNAWGLYREYVGSKWIMEFFCISLNRDPTVFEFTEPLFLSDEEMKKYDS